VVPNANLEIGNQEMVAKIITLIANAISNRVFLDSMNNSKEGLSKIPQFHLMVQRTLLP
jgi:hypothetical protein